MHQFLQDEDGAGDRRVEGGAEARAGPGRDQHAAVRPASTKYPADEMGEARPHLDGGALAPKRQARANGQHSAGEFHRDQEKRRWRKLAAQNGFDVRDAASDACGEKRRTSQAASAVAAAHAAITNRKPTASRP